jgi:hypothetical protein
MQRDKAAKNTLSRRERVAAERASPGASHFRAVSEAAG